MVKTSAVSNFVMIKILDNTTEYNIGPGKSIKLSTEVIDDDGSVNKYGDMNHMPCIGCVMNVPDRLIFIPGVRHENYMDWRTSIEISVGDTVIIRRLAVSKALSSGMYYKDGNDLYVFIKYDSLIMSINDSGSKVLNGYVIIGLVDVDKSDKIVIPQKTSYKGSKVGEVIMCGSFNTEYHPTYTINNAMDYDGSGDIDNISAGDKILFKTESWSELENSIHKIFNIGKYDTYYKIQRNRILAKLWV